MAERQYGIVPGASITGTPPPQTLRKPLQRTRSPPKQYVPQQSIQQEHVDRPVFADAPPPPPVHRSLPSNSRNTLMPTPTPQIMDNSSDLSEYHPPDPFRDVDNLYSPSLRTPSPARSSAYNAPQHRSSPVRPGMAATRSSEHAGVPFAMTPALASPSPSGSIKSPFRDDAASRLSAPSLMARQTYYQGDGYDDFDPNAIADDGDDGIEEHQPRSRSRMGFGAAPTGAAAGLPAFLKPFGARDTSGQYDSVPTTSFVNDKTQATEKSAWLEDEHDASRRRRRLLLIIGAIIILLAIIGGVTGGVLATRNKSSNKSSSSGSSSGTSSGSRTGGLYDIDSSEVQSLMNNKDLHRVFPAMDYTPLNAQYPACLTNAPDQNNVTLDVALLSQLTPAIRLYGTDCSQTEMVLTAIDRLKMNDTMSVWLGVWLGTNTTTNNRQLAQMYDILDKYPTKHFAGVIIGNEVLFRKDMTLTQLSNVLTEVRSNFTAKKISLPVSTSDLGDNWTAGLAATSDIVMANVHPFFAGVTPDVAPGWTYNFWQTHNANLATAKTGSWPKSIVSEVGWPSEGGNDCGTATGACPSGQGAVASIDNMNKFMDGFVCQSLNNGTSFFWFEAFDEPWKVIYETATDGWESHWGLMDTNRNLKSGVKIPDCGGKTLSKAY